MRKPILWTIAAALAGGMAGLLTPARAAAPIRVMLLDGSNNHDWKATSPVIQKILEETGLFRIERVTVDNAELGAFKPDWKQHDVVVLNYNTGIGADAPQWPAAVKSSFQQFVADGGGVVSVHAADN